MRIDPATGRVLFESGLEVGPGTPAADLRANGSASERYGNGFGWEQLEVVEDGVQWSVAVSIGPDEIAQMVTFAMVDPGQASSGGGWNLEAEVARRDRHDAWLDAQLGTGWMDERWRGASTGGGRSYPWGRLGSAYDERSGGSAITLDWRRSDT